MAKKFKAYQISPITEQGTGRFKFESLSGGSTSYGNAKLTGQALVRGRQFGAKGATWVGCSGQEVIGESGSYRLITGVDFVSAPRTSAPSEEAVAA